MTTDTSGANVNFFIAVVFVCFARDVGVKPNARHQQHRAVLSTACRCWTARSRSFACSSLQPTFVLLSGRQHRCHKFSVCRPAFFDSNNLCVALAMDNERPLLGEEIGDEENEAERG